MYKIYREIFGRDRFSDLIDASRHIPFYRFSQSSTLGSNKISLYRLSRTRFFGQDRAKKRNDTLLRNLTERKKKYKGKKNGKKETRSFSGRLMDVTA